MKKLLISAILPALVLSVNTLLAQNYNLQLRGTLDFPGQTLANICGYAQNGHEYALVGASHGLAIVEVTNPDVPQLIVQLPGPDNLWKEIKTYSHYAYVTSEGGQGIHVVDLSQLPDPMPANYFYTGDGAIQGQLSEIHSLHIDTTAGFLYAYGGPLFNGGAKVFDLKPDPYHPVYVGKFNQLGYVHDGFVDNDTLYACHINSGFLSIVDMHSKGNPQVLGTTETPARFTHNSWLLSDHKHILTTDERVPSFVTSYDISDPTDIQELDRIATTPNGLASIGHNTHVLNDWAITSWYIDGVTLVDAHRPQNLIQVGRYDTYEGDGEFDGCWGVYPFLPSGNLVASNIPNIASGVTGKLFVLTPTYKRACYLEGSVISSCTNQGEKGVDVVIASNDPLAFTQTRNDGSYKTGQPTPGTFTVTVSKAGFITQTFTVELTPGEVMPLNVVLEPVSAFSITGTVMDGANGQPLSNVPVVVYSNLATYNRQTDAAGQFNLNCVPGTDYQLTADAWGYLPASLVINHPGATVVSLQRGYYDDFAFDLGWTTAFTAPRGRWAYGDPNGTYYNNSVPSNPEDDAATDGNPRCYVTGNAGGSESSDDVDDGAVFLTSPVMQLSTYQDAILTFQYWFFNSGGVGLPNDKFRVEAMNGTDTVTIFEIGQSLSVWRPSNEIHLSDFIDLTDNVRIRFTAADVNPGHLVEAGLDVFKVVPVSFVNTGEVGYVEATLNVVPNPTASSFSLRYDWPGTKDVVLEVRNNLGQVVMMQQTGGSSGYVECGENWPTGLYIATLRNAEHRSVPVKMIKQ